MVLTPGGRFSKEIPGLVTLADALAEGGIRVLTWDRPNCGHSQVQFYGQSESTCAPRRCVDFSRPSTPGHA